MQEELCMKLISHLDLFSGAKILLCCEDDNLTYILSKQHVDVYVAVLSSLNTSDFWDITSIKPACTFNYIIDNYFLVSYNWDRFYVQRLGFHLAEKEKMVSICINSEIYFKNYLKVSKWI